MNEIIEKHKMYMKRYGYIDFNRFIKMIGINSIADIFELDTNDNSYHNAPYREVENDRCNSYEPLRGIIIEPSSELDRQTWDRWTKKESLQEQ